MSEIANTAVFAGADEVANSLSTVISIISEQKIASWTDESFVQEMHLQNEKLKQQTEDMKAKTAAALEETKENESEIVDIQKSKELMINSMDLTRTSIVLTGQQIELYERELVEWRKKYDDTLKEHREKLDSFKRTLTEDLPLFEKLENLKIDEKRLLVDLKHKTSILEQLKESKKQSREIKRQIFNADIVSFTKACQSYKTCKDMSEQVEKLEEMQKQLQLRFKELQHKKEKKEGEEYVGSCLRFFKENDTFEEVPSVTSILNKSTLAHANSSTSLLDFSKNPKLMIENFKMPIVPPKYKYQSYNTDSKIQILNVQTILPQDSNIFTEFKTGYQPRAKGPNEAKILSTQPISSQNESNQTNETVQNNKSLNLALTINSANNIQKTQQQSNGLAEFEITTTKYKRQELQYGNALKKFKRSDSETQIISTQKDSSIVKEIKSASQPNSDDNMFNVQPITSQKKSNDWDKTHLTSGVVSKGVNENFVIHTINNSNNISQVKQTITPRVEARRLAEFENIVDSTKNSNQRTNDTKQGNENKKNGGAENKHMFSQTGNNSASTQMQFVNNDSKQLRNIGIDETNNIFNISTDVDTEGVQYASDNEDCGFVLSPVADNAENSFFKPSASEEIFKLF